MALDESRIIYYSINYFIGAYHYRCVICYPRQILNHSPHRESYKHLVTMKEL